MSIFKYKVINNDGDKVDGYIEAVNIEEAAGNLQERGFQLLLLKEKKKKSNIDFISNLNWIKQKDVVVFSRQFSVMISANVALVQSLRILVDQTINPKFKMIIAEIADEVDGGARLSEALSKRPKVFSEFYVNIIRSGETSGKLDEVLNYLADEMEKDYDLTSKIRGAMIYPAFVMSGLLAVGALMLIFIVPKLTEIIKESGGELPIQTRMLIGLSEFMIGYWWLIIAIVAGGVVLFRAYTRTSQGERQYDYLKLKMPIFGQLLQKIYMVRFTRSMNTLIMGGVPITKGLHIAAGVVSNRVYKDLIYETAKAVEEGDSISSIFIQSAEIPKMVSQMMSVGEKTGKLDLVLKKISDFYSREVSNTINNLMSLMEPIILVIMGVAVGIMVAAVIMPMYNLANTQF